MHLHNNEIENLLGEYLPTRYASEVVRRLGLKGIEISTDVVRNVRNNRSAKYFDKILFELIELSKEAKSDRDRLNSLLSGKEVKNA